MSFLPATNSGDGRSVLTSAQFLSASRCELNQWEELTSLTQRETWRGRGIQPERTDWQGRRNLRSACLQALYHCSQSNMHVKNTLFQNNHRHSFNSFLGFEMVTLPEPTHTRRELLKFRWQGFPTLTLRWTPAQSKNYVCPQGTLKRSKKKKTLCDCYK